LQPLFDDLDTGIAALDAQSEALDERVAATMAYIDAHKGGAVVADLRALGIDRAETRWLALHDYLAELRAGFLAQTDRALVLLFAAGYMQQATPSGWIGRPGIFEGIAAIKRSFGPEAAAWVAEEYLPPDLRESKPYEPVTRIH
jgi:hypothetical protein